MAKQRKLRSSFNLKQTGDLPDPEEVKNLVKKTTQPEKTTKEEPRKPPTQKTTRKTAVPKKKPEPKKMGRPPLEIRRIKYTTALTEENKIQLQLLAIKKGRRQSDVLNEILEKHFSKNKIELPK